MATKISEEFGCRPDTAARAAGQRAAPPLPQASHERLTRACTLTRRCRVLGTKRKSWPQGSSSVLVGRHGATRPGGKYAT